MNWYILLSFVMIGLQNSGKREHSKTIFQKTQAFKNHFAHNQFDLIANFQAPVRISSNNCENYSESNIFVFQLIKHQHPIT